MAVNVYLGGGPSGKVDKQKEGDPQLWNKMEAFILFQSCGSPSFYL